MKIKLFYMLFFTILTSNAIAQVKEKYSQKELQTFLKVYKHSIDKPFDIVKSMQNNASKINIPEARFSEILQAQFAGNTPSLTDIETKEMSKLKMMMEEDELVYTENLKKYTIAQGLIYSKYKEIEKQYNSDLKFQRKINKLNQK